MDRSKNPCIPPQYTADMLSQEIGEMMEEALRRNKILEIVGDYDLGRLQELVESDREGKCLTLPCNVLGTAYTNITIQGDRYKISDRPYRVKIIFIGIGETSIYFNVEYDNGRVFPFDSKDIGKTIFLTRDAAEAALKEMEK